jgi:hypothetical protein
VGRVDAIRERNGGPLLYRLARRSDRPQELTVSVVVPGAAWARPLRPRGDSRLQTSIGRALRLSWLASFRQRLYGCLTGRADALFELTDAVLCADHAVTSLVELSLEPEFRRGHGALYDALAAGSIDEGAFADLLAEVLPVSGPPRRPLPVGVSAGEAEWDVLADTLAELRPGQARAVAEACLPRGGRLRFAVDGTPYPRPDAECSPGRHHVHHDACRCDGTRKTIPGWEYQFVAALGQLRSSWTALVDVARTTRGTRAAVTADQIRALIRRLERTGQSGGDMPAPIVVADAGYPATVLTAALTGVNVHLVVRLPAKNVYYRDPITWPGKDGSPAGAMSTPRSTVTARSSPTGTATCPSSRATWSASGWSTCPTAAPRPPPCGCGTPGPSCSRWRRYGGPTSRDSTKSTPSGSGRACSG